MKGGLRLGSPSPPSGCTFMPLQCYLKWTEFQEADVVGEYRKVLLHRCRPCRCPYCGEYHRMLGHGFETRYIILGDGSTRILLVPRFRCHACRKTIRVLPLQLHSHCNHLSETIIEQLASRITEGCFINASPFEKSLRRHWYAGLSKQVHRFTSVGIVDDALERLWLLPSFSILFKNRWETRMARQLVYRRPPFHRIFPLIVCADTS